MAVVGRRDWQVPAGVTRTYVATVMVRREKIRYAGAFQATPLRLSQVMGAAVVSGARAAKAALFFLFLVLSLASNPAAGQVTPSSPSPSEDVNELIARGDYEVADRVFAAELERHPGDFRLLYNRALARYLAGQLERSREILLSVPPADRAQVNYQVLLSTVCTRLGAHKDALPPAQEAVKLVPSDPDNWLRLGALYLRLRQGQHATDVYETGRSLFPTRPEFLLGLGVVEQMQAKFPEAISLFRQVVEAFPRLDAGYLFLAQVQLKAARPAEARETAEKLVRLNPRSAFAEYLAGEAAWAIPGKESEAAPHVQRALELNPRLVEALLLAAKIELRQGDPHKAVAHLKEAIAAEPRVDTGHLLLARAYRQMGDARRAESELAAFRQLRQAEEQENQLLSNFLANGARRP